MPVTGSDSEDLLSRLSQAEQELLRLREEVRVLSERIKDLHNVIRDSLQIATSVVGVKAASWNTPEVKQFTANIRTRLDAIGAVFARPDPLGIDSFVDLSACMTRIVREIEAVYGGHRGIGLRLTTSDIHVHEKTATSLALIAVELIANAFQHAFSERPFGTIEVCIEALDRDRGRLWVADNGTGLPLSIRPNWPQAIEGRRFSGLYIALALAREMGSELLHEPGPGTRIGVTFPAGR